MDSKKALVALQAVPQEHLEIVEIHMVAADPHPYVIGPTHLSRNDSMYLGESQIRDMERKHGPMCYHKEKRERCTLKYDEHHVKYAALVRAKHDLSFEELQTALLLLKPVAEEHKLEGFAFLKSEFTIEGVR